MLMVSFVVIAAVLAGIGFFHLYRPWQLRWGATGKEVRQDMPGDEVVPAPTFNATRAVTVDARPEAIWPWIVQIGFGRAGWYSYDFLDNFGRHSADAVRPELQHVAIGDLVPLGPGKNSGMRVKEFVPNQWMLWWDKKRMTWAWTLDPMPDGRTRLVTRVRSRFSWRHPFAAIWWPLLEVADFPMMRKCMLGIKRRAQVVVPGHGVDRS